MGLLSSHLHILAMEQEKYPIRGDVLTLGQQALYDTLEDVKNIFTSHNITLKPLKDEFDIKSKIPSCVGTPREKSTNAGAALTLLGAERVLVLASSSKA